MGYLIILRGPAGSGKDTIGGCLIKKLGGDILAHLLDLDITDPLEEQYKNDVTITSLLKK
jgi:ribose 1,5-bisphosphokinase PhnN